ncbi:MAG: hypothetical protein EPN82_14000 [Bacteroidetes bacterium]|nr:MAG: hypothetical protein EPN82_14000 [Bacteroidota bacterium]
MKNIKSIILLIFFISIYLLKSENNNEINFNKLKFIANLEIDSNSNFNPFSFELVDNKNLLYTLDLINNKINIFNLIDGKLTLTLKEFDEIKYFYNKKEENLWENTKPNCTYLGLFKDVYNSKIFIIAGTKKKVGVKPILDTVSGLLDTAIMISKPLLFFELNTDTLLCIKEFKSVSNYFTGYDACKFKNKILVENTQLNNDHKLIFWDLVSNKEIPCLIYAELENFLNYKFDKHFSGLFENIDENNIIYYSIPNIPPLKINIYNKNSSFTPFNYDGIFKYVQNIYYLKNNKFSNFQFMDSIYTYYFQACKFYKDKILFLINKYDKENKIVGFYVQTYNKELFFKKEIYIPILSNNRVDIVNFIGTYKKMFLIMIKTNGIYKILDISKFI